jgi:hypothetical protein
MATHKWTNTLNRGNSPNPAQTATITGDGENVRQLTIPGATTNQQIIIAFAIAAMKSLFIKASGLCTLKTNSSGAPDDTFTLDADSGVIWHNQLSAANPITADVTTMYVTTPSGDPVDLEIYVLVDATP